MIDNLRIRNYKSIVDLSIDLGRFNVIIGTNGCGKSNILEAITLASAASQNKLDAESLNNRSIRETEPLFMMNAFDDTENNLNESVISIDINSEEYEKGTSAIIEYSSAEEKWVNRGNITDKPKVVVAFEQIQKMANGPEDFEKYKSMIQDNMDTYIKIMHFITKNKGKKSFTMSDLYNSFDEQDIKRPSFSSFIAFRPVEKILRDFNNFTTYPLGSRGEGLFQYLKRVSNQNEGKDLFIKINDGLKMLDWFDGFNIPDGLLSNEYKLSIGDKFLKDSLHYFDQRSTNEGFLYLLFFLTLFNSKDTPQFFAVDNIETSFNPGLCQNLTKYLVKTTKENGKQVILTTHNPFVLDGMDLSDDEIRLFVCRRNIDGHTKIERVKYREDRKMSLSELWMSGLIGALPDNF